MNTAGNYSKTALHIEKMLLAVGVDVNSEDGAGRKPYLITGSAKPMGDSSTK